MRLTKAAVDKLPAPKTIKAGKTVQKRYYDDSLKGFGIRVTSGGTKSFFIEKLINNKQRRITIGRYPELTVELARKEALKFLHKIATGIDPIAEKKENKAKRITLQEAFEDYLKARKSLKPRTIFDYHQVMKESFNDWRNKPLLDITKDMIAKRHTKVGQRSQARANLAMRTLRAIFNFAMGEYENAKGRSLITENPVKRLSHTRAWYKVKRRDTVIKEHELAAWHDALANVQPERIINRIETIKDYLLLLLFTGLRRAEAAKLTWDRVDLIGKTITIIDTKNSRNHVLPLSNFLFDLLNKRKETSNSDFVFPSTSKTGYIVEPRKVMQKITDISGVQFTLHDLRRTFITIAESLDIPAYALKKLLNHKTNSDVTAGYIVIDVERLRKPMQTITDYLLRTTKINGKNNMVKLNVAKEN
ncbi:MAG: integrase arm-type DNA-binding domain-containing protein [Gammaproteobacteria bacterium]|jgi:integrase